MESVATASASVSVNISNAAVMDDSSVTLQPSLRALLHAASSIQPSRQEAAPEHEEGKVIALLQEASERVLQPLLESLDTELAPGRLQSVSSMHVLAALAARQTGAQGWHPLRQPALFNGPTAAAEDADKPLSLRSALAAGSIAGLLSHPRARLPHLLVQLQRLCSALPFASLDNVLSLLRCDPAERVRLERLVSALVAVVRTHPAPSTAADANAASWKARREQALAQVAAARARAKAGRVKDGDEEHEGEGGDEDDDDDDASSARQQAAAAVAFSTSGRGELADLSGCPSLFPDKQADDELRRKFASEDVAALCALPPTIGLQRVYEPTPAATGAGIGAAAASSSSSASVSASGDAVSEAQPWWMQPVRDIRASEPSLTLILQDTEQFDAAAAAGGNLFGQRNAAAAMAPQTTSACVPEALWLQRWRNLTNGVFDGGFDWTNVFAAGGSVLGCLSVGGSDASASGLRRAAFDQTDVDLFLVGLESPEAATAKLRQIVAHLQAAMGATADNLLLSSHSVTVLGMGDFPTVQIVLRCYTSPAEVLLGFDVDSCCVGFDGRDVWANHRAVRALSFRVNVVDLSRRSTTYEARLIKYAGRGFAVGVANLDLAQVDKGMLESTWRAGVALKAQGLTRLLLEHFRPRYRWSYRNNNTPVTRAREAARQRDEHAKSIAEVDALATPATVAKLRVAEARKMPARWRETVPELDEDGLAEAKTLESSVTPEQQELVRGVLLERADYGWIGSMGSLTPNTLAKLWAAAPEGQGQEVLSWRMRDGRYVFLVRFAFFLRADGDGQAALPCGLEWLTRNPGQQDAVPILAGGGGSGDGAGASADAAGARSSAATKSGALFTGSFQPLSADLSSWSRLSEWHRAHVGDSASFGALFYALACLRRGFMARQLHAHLRASVDSSSRPYVDQHVSDLVAEYLTAEDITSFPDDEEEEEKGETAAAKKKTDAAQEITKQKLDVSPSLLPQNTGVSLCCTLQETSLLAALPRSALPDSCFLQIVAQLPSSLNGAVTLTLSSHTRALLYRLSLHVLAGVVRGLRHRHPRRLEPNSSDKLFDVSVRDVEAAFRHLLTGQLCAHALEEGDRRCGLSRSRYEYRAVVRVPQALEKRAGLALPVRAVQRALGSLLGRQSTRVDTDAAVFVAAVIEILLAEVIDLAVAELTDTNGASAGAGAGAGPGIAGQLPPHAATGAGEVQVHHVVQALSGDEELSDLFSGLLLPQTLPVPDAQVTQTLRNNLEQALKSDNVSGDASAAAASQQQHPFSLLLSQALPSLLTTDGDAARANVTLAPVLRELLCHFFAATRGGLKQLHGGTGTTETAAATSKGETEKKLLDAASVLLLPRLSPFLSSGTEEKQLELVLLLHPALDAKDGGAGAVLPVSLPVVQQAQQSLSLLMQQLDPSLSALSSSAILFPVTGGACAATTLAVEHATAAAAAYAALSYATPLEDAQLRQAGVAPLIAPAFFRQQLQAELSGDCALPPLSPAALLVYQLYFEAALLRVLRVSSVSSATVASLWQMQEQLIALLPAKRQATVRESIAAVSASPSEMDLADTGLSLTVTTDGSSKVTAAVAGAGAAAAPVRPSLYPKSAEDLAGESPWLPWVARRFPALYRTQVTQALERQAAHEAAVKADQVSVAIPNEGAEEEKNDAHRGRWRSSDRMHATTLLVPAFPSIVVDGGEVAQTAAAAASTESGDAIARAGAQQHVDPLGVCFAPAELEMRPMLHQGYGWGSGPRTGTRHATQLAVLLLEQCASGAGHIIRSGLSAGSAGDRREDSSDGGGGSGGRLLDEGGLVLDARAFRGLLERCFLQRKDIQPSYNGHVHLRVTAAAQALMQLLLEAELRRMLHDARTLQRTTVTRSINCLPSGHRTGGGSAAVPSSSPSAAASSSSSSSSLPSAVSPVRPFGVRAAWSMRYGATAGNTSNANDGAAVPAPVPSTLSATNNNSLRSAYKTLL